MSELSRAFESSSAAFVQSTTNGVSSLGASAQRALAAGSNAFVDISEHAVTLRRLLDDRQAKFDEGMAKINAIQAELAANQAGLTDDVNKIAAEIERRTHLENETARDESERIKRHQEQIVDEVGGASERLYQLAFRQIDDTNSNYLKQYQSIMESLKENNQLSTNHTLDNIQELRQFDEEKSEQLAEFESTRQTHLKDVCERIETEIESNKKQLVETLAELADETVVREKVAFDQQLSNSLNVLKKLKATLDKRSQDYNDFLTKRIQEVEDLVENKYRNELVTGRTPKRKPELQDTIELTKTRPHDELLDAFRKKTQQAAGENIDEFKMPMPRISPPASEIESCISGISSMSQPPSSKRANYGSPNDVENMDVDEKIIAPQIIIEKPAQPSARTIALAKSNSSKSLTAAANRKATSSTALRDRNA